MDLWDCALGFMDSQMLLTAEELGVFDALDEAPRTAAEVARAIDVPEDSAERLLIGLTSLEILRKGPDGRYENGPEAAERLVRGKPGYIGDMFRHVREDLYPLWAHFREALREGAPQWERAFGGERARNEEIHSDPESLRAFHTGMHVITYRAAEEFASYAQELREIRTLVDVGGSSGGFLIALARANPELRGIVLDLPGVQPIAESFFSEYDLADRLEFRPADFFHDPLPEGADAYALGFILHDWDTASGSRLLGKIAAAARPGARLIIGEYLLDDEKTGPHWVARSSLNMLVAARGKERNAAEYADWLGGHGFDLEKIYLTGTGKNFMIFRRR